MKDVYSLEDARKYSEEIRVLTTLEKVNLRFLGKSLKILAEAEDEAAFKRIVDTYVKIAKQSDNVDLRGNPLSFLELMCAGLDHGFSTIGFAALRAKAGILEPKPLIKQTQGFFRRIYGTNYVITNPSEN